MRTQRESLTEAQRLAALGAYGILDTPPEDDLNDLVRLAAQICAAPIALISLVDERRQWFKAAYGTNLVETAREFSFCAHAIQGPDLFVVPDATRHAAFANNPLVLGEPKIRLYAGAPLVTPDGAALGTLCVIDREARDLSPDQANALSVLSRHVMAQFELKRRAQERNRINRALLSLLEDERLAEAAVRESEALNRAVLDSLPSGIAVLDSTSKLVAVNAVWRQYAAEDDAANHNPVCTLRVGDNYLAACAAAAAGGAEHAASISSQLGALLRGKQSSFTLEYPLPVRGMPRRMLFGATPLRTQNGGAVISHTDVTERVALEEQLRQAHRLEAIGQLTGGVAHDFNNLLTVILGNAELIREHLGDAGALRESADMIVEASRSAADLTRRLLAFARKQALNPSSVDPSGMISAMYSLLRRTLGEHIDIELALDADPWRALVDSGELENALLNLCINSRDAMAGGGRLSIATTKLHLEDASMAHPADLQPGDFVVITVTDNGGGIPPEVLAHVYEPFFTTKDKSGGTGLGLAMVYGFVKQSGGNIRIQSELGRGTTVDIYLPRASAGETSLQRNAVADSVRGTETILLVEDNEDVRRFAFHHLQSMGYVVLQAGNGVEALETLATHDEVDLLFTDVVMPGGLSGRQLADAALARNPRLKVLFTSGYNDNVIVHHGRLDDGVHLLPKPYRRSELAQRIRAVLDGT